MESTFAFANFFYIFFYNSFIYHTSNNGNQIYIIINKYKNLPLNVFDHQNSEMVEEEMTFLEWKGREGDEIFLSEEEEKMSGGGGK